MKIFHWIRLRRIVRNAENEMAKLRQRAIQKPKMMRRVGVLMDVDCGVKTITLQKHLSDIGLAQEKITFLHYAPATDKTPEEETDIFGTHDFNLVGYPDKKIQDFCDKDFDLLINYFITTRPALSLVSAQTKSRIRVGFQAVDQRLNDLIFSVPENQPRLFCQQMDTYLNTIVNQ